MRKRILIALAIIILATVVGIIVGGAWHGEIHRQDRPPGTYIVYEMPEV